MYIYVYIHSAHGASLLSCLLLTGVSLTRMCTSRHTRIAHVTRGHAHMYLHAWAQGHACNATWAHTLASVKHRRVAKLCSLITFE